MGQRERESHADFPPRIVPDMGLDPQLESRTLRIQGLSELSRPRAPPFSAAQYLLPKELTHYFFADVPFRTFRIWVWLIRNCGSPVVCRRLKILKIIIKNEQLDPQDGSLLTFPHTWFRHKNKQLLYAELCNCVSRSPLSIAAGNPPLTHFLCWVQVQALVCALCPPPPHFHLLVLEVWLCFLIK